MDIKFNQIQQLSLFTPFSQQRKNQYEITFTNTKFNSFKYIIFKNYYSESISMKAVDNEGQGYCILNDYKLMQFPDCEEESEKIIILQRNIFNMNIDQLDKYIDNIVKIVITIYQSSIDIISFKITDLIMIDEELLYKIDLDFNNKNDCLCVKDDEIYDFYVRFSESNFDQVNILL